MKNVRNYIEQFIIIFLASIILFTIFDVQFKFYSILFIGIYILLKVKFKKNVHLINKLYFIIGIATLSSFLFANYIKNRMWIISVDCVDKYLAVSIIVILLYCIGRIKHFPNANTNECGDSVTLMNPQRYDADRIMQYIAKFDIVGINGAWGTGKSYITNYIINKDSKDKGLIFITIDLLSCNLEQIHSVIFDSISRVLNSKCVFSKNSRIIKKFLGNINFINNLYSMLVSDAISYTDALADLKKELNDIAECIVIVYEDIDRINDINTIKKIFSISEQLVCKKIKILYQYDGENLEKQGFDREYIEKYIPYVVNLTPIDIIEIIKHLLDTETYPNISDDDFKFMKLPIYVTIQEHQLSISLSLYGCSIRKVKLFLDELSEALEENKLYREKCYKKKVVCFFVIKHFYYDFYKDFQIAEPLMDTISFEYENKNYTIPELIRFFENNQTDTEKEYKEIFGNSNNGIRLFFLETFEYKLPKSVSNKTTYSLDALYAPDTESIKINDDNERNDRLICNLMYSGKSEYTNNEHAAKKFITDVLSKSVKEQNIAYETFRNDMFNGNFDKDNETIFKIGKDPMYSMFAAFSLLHPGIEMWKEIIDFYIPIRIGNINTLLVASLYWCDLSHNSFYIHVLNKFNELNAVGNLNKMQCYMKFFKKYLKALPRLGYIDTSELEYIRDADIICGYEDVSIDILQALTYKLNELKNSIPIKQVKRDINIILCFIKKNMEVIMCEEDQPEKPLLKVSCQSHYKNQEEIDRLRKIENRDEFIKETENSYSNDKITPYEIQKLIMEYDEKDLKK